VSQPDGEDRLGAALAEEAVKKSALIWVSVGDARPRPLWHVWAGGSAYVVSGGAEQPFPGLDEALAGAGPVTVTVRSKDKGGRLVSYRAKAARVEPGSEEWDTAVAELHAKRLNAHDGEEQPQRWRRESAVTRLDLTGDLLEEPGRMPADGHSAPPPPTPATTLGPLPYVLGRRRGRRKTAPGSGR
jgi:hypothetical protein